jgi:hypothetical protein
MPPRAADFGPEAIQSEQVRGHSIVSEIALYHTVKPSATERVNDFETGVVRV